jgi:hypothetical protein
MARQPITTASQLVRALDQHGAITISGPQGLVVARHAIELLMEQTGYTMLFDPSSSPDLVDYLTVTTIAGLEGAIAGASLGALFGIFLKHPAAGAAVGALVGGLAGAGLGVQRVESGWRVCAVRDIDGAPVVTIYSLTAE